MGEGDEWPGILEKVLDSEIVILATPIWWSDQSSLIQRVVERLDELHDKVMAGAPSLLGGKVGGLVITGDSDGAQHVIANLCNFWVCPTRPLPRSPCPGSNRRRAKPHEGRTPPQVRIGLRGGSKWSV